MNPHVLDLSSLSLEDRLTLAQALWDSIDADAHAAPLTPEQLEEIDRRIAAADAGEIVGIPWETVRDQLIPQK